MKSTSLVQQFFRHSVGSRRSRAVWLRSSWCSVTWHGWLWGGEMGACNGHLFSPDHQHQQPAKEEEAGRQAVLQKLPLPPFPPLTFHTNPISSSLFLAAANVPSLGPCEHVPIPAHPSLPFLHPLLLALPHPPSTRRSKNLEKTLGVILNHRHMHQSRSGDKEN